MKCPLCGGHFRKFLTINERKNAFCPKCGSLERHRLLWLYLKQRNDFFQKKLRVLHVAPIEKFQKQFNKMKNLEYISINIIPKRAMFTMDLTQLTFENNYFDIIICSHVLEHISNDKLAMQELYRVLKINGWGLILVPIDLKLQKTLEDPSIQDPIMRREIYGQEDHLRNYGLDFIDRLKNAGFKVNIDDFIESIDKKKKKKYGINVNEKIFFISK
ncbi:MAG: methyltransferase domain-containing protein [Promethearchaeota archaeon]